MQASQRMAPLLKSSNLKKAIPEIQGQKRVFRLIPKVQTMSMSNYTGRMNGFLAVKNSDGVLVCRRVGFSQNPVDWNYCIQIYLKIRNFRSEA